MGVSSTGAPARGGGTASGKEKLLAKFRRDPILVPIYFLEPDQNPTPVTLGAPFHTTISTAFITHAEEMVGEIGITD